MHKCYIFYSVHMLRTLIGTRNLTYRLARISEDKDFHQKPMKKEPYERKQIVYEELPMYSLNPTGKLKVILCETVEDLGVRGDIIEVRKEQAYNELFPPGLALYASPDNIKKYSTSENTFTGSAFSIGVIRNLKEINLRILMNGDNDWTLLPKHISVAFRLNKYCVPEHCITIPNPITYKANVNDMSVIMENFKISVRINNRESIPVQCHIDLYSKDMMKMKEILKNKEKYLEQT